MSTKSKKGRTIGRPPKHGGYSLIHRDALFKDHPEIRRYLQECRDGLVECVAGSEEALSEQQRIMIDRIVSRLSICRLIEVYVEKKGIFAPDGSLVSSLGNNYLAFSNSIDRALIALGLDKKEAPGQTLEAVIAEFDARKRARIAQDGRSQSQAAAGQGEDVRAQAESQGEGGLQNGAAARKPGQGEADHE